MKHIAIIQSEFLKQARQWDDLTLEEQKGYLKRHPKSKRRLTAAPSSSAGEKLGTDAESMIKFDFKLWRRLNVSDRDTLDQPQNWQKYIAAIRQAVPRGTAISQETIRKLESENHHAMLAALSELGRINY